MQLRRCGQEFAAHLRQLVQQSLWQLGSHCNTLAALLPYHCLGPCAGIQQVLGVQEAHCTHKAIVRAD
jgi:hypothetical protein